MQRQHSSSTVFLLVLAIFGVLLVGYVSLRDPQQPATMTGRLVGRTARFPIALDPTVLPIIKRAILDADGTVIDGLIQGCSYRIWWIIRICASEWIRAGFFYGCMPPDHLHVAPLAHYRFAQAPVGPNGPTSPQRTPSGAGGSGTAKSSRTLQRRLVNPAAIAGVRCR
jgi:hypothetical protein